MGTLRWRSRLDGYIRSYLRSPLAKLDAEVLTALRLGAYQLAFLERIPVHAAVNESVELVKRAHKTSAATLVNAVLRKIAAFTGQRRAPEGQPAAERSVHMPAGLRSPALLARFYGHPEWLVERWVERFGLAAAERICRYDQTMPQVAVRLREAPVEDELKAEGIQLVSGALLSTARRVLAGDVTRTRAFAAGRVSIQDEGSQLVAALLGHGTRLLDCCAAPGGKAAILARRNPEAIVVAVELHPHRARLLRRMLDREQVHAEVITADSTALPLNGTFDRILADVPCSGTGTLARHPEIKWRLQPADLPALQAKQVAILRSALECLAPGGQLLYSSCSLEKEENEDVIELALSPGFRLLDCRQELVRLRDERDLVWNDLASLASGPFLRTIPDMHPCDGFFAALMARS